MIPTVAAAVIVLHVANYNLTAHLEYHTRIFTKLIGKHAIYFYAVYLMISALFRDHIMNETIVASSEQFILFPQEQAEVIGKLLFLLGVGLNLWTLKALGIKGMYNGDSFGWLMNEPVTGGPFQYFSDPQYVGTTIAALGHAVTHQKTVGYLLTLVLGLTFYFSAKFVEAPHMNYIYSHREKSQLYNKPTHAIPPLKDSKKNK
eukprot:TRINITY_DN957_c0_g1_i1.p1 TRINITY_DN957_c0_g1~~TRINITY_DN957_c0_g1_i1.p1  ORF type:complete len:203 (-),score=31.35 TRINITY_DN957_c0_g1_i1:36-644(-)